MALYEPTCAGGQGGACHDNVENGFHGTAWLQLSFRAGAGYDRATVHGMTSYADYKPLTFHDAARRFTDGNDNPRAYLERCLETITAREPVVKALDRDQ